MIGFLTSSLSKGKNPAFAFVLRLLSSPERSENLSPEESLIKSARDNRPALFVVIPAGNLRFLSGGKLLRRLDQTFPKRSEELVL